MESSDNETMPLSPICSLGGDHVSQDALVLKLEGVKRSAANPSNTPVAPTRSVENPIESLDSPLSAKSSTCSPVSEKVAAGERYLYYAAERTRLQDELDKSIKYSKTLELELKKLRLAGTNTTLPTSPPSAESSNTKTLEIERLRKGLALQASALVEARARHKEMAEKAQKLEESLLSAKQVSEELEQERVINHCKRVETFAQTDTILVCNTVKEGTENVQGKLEGGILR